MFVVANYYQLIMIIGLPDCTALFLAMLQRHLTRHLKQFVTLIIPWQWIYTVVWKITSYYSFSIQASERQFFRGNKKIWPVGYLRNAFCGKAIFPRHNLKHKTFPFVFFPMLYTWENDFFAYHSNAFVFMLRSFQGICIFFFQVFEYGSPWRRIL